MSKVQVGVDYCRIHDGICNEDASVCDFLDADDPEHACEVCEGTGAAEDPDDGDTFDCAACDGQGLTPCDLVPLFYEGGES